MIHDEPKPVPSFGALRRYQTRCEAMYLDRELTGDLLAVGLAFAYLVDIADRADLRPSVAAQWLWPCPPHAHGPAHQAAATARLHKVLRADIRRYLTPACNGMCDARVGGLACGLPGIAYGATITDPATGEETPMSACSRHVEWLTRLAVANRAECAAVDVPQPAANSGGVLARHLPELDWPSMWARLDPRWEPVPEPVVEGGRPSLGVIPGGGMISEPVRPALRLIVSGDDA